MINRKYISYLLTILGVFVNGSALAEHTNNKLFSNNTYYSICVQDENLCTKISPGQQTHFPATGTRFAWHRTESPLNHTAYPSSSKITFTPKQGEPFIDCHPSKSWLHDWYNKPRPFAKLTLHGFYHGATFELWQSSQPFKITEKWRPMIHTARIAGRATTLLLCTVPLTDKIISILTKK